MDRQRQAALLTRARALGWTTPVSSSMRMSVNLQRQIQDFIQAVQDNRDAPIRFAEVRGGREERGGGVMYFGIEHDLNERRLMTWEGLDEAGAELQDMFNRLLLFIAGRRGLRPTDPVQIALKDNGPQVSTDFIPLEEHAANDLIHLMHGFTSGRQYRIRLSRARVVVSFQRLRRGHGGVRHVRAALTAKEYVMRKNSLIRTTEKDCFYQCVVLAQHYHAEDKKKYNYLCKQQANARREKYARECRERLGRLEGVTIGEFPELERQLNLSFMMIDHLDLSISYETQNPGHPWCFFYRYVDEEQTHYAFLKPHQVQCLYKDKRHFCFKCMKAFYNLKHPCFELCRKCENKDCPAEEDPKPCHECHLTFRNQFCYDSHKKKKCTQEKKCTKCYRIYKVHKRYDHKCYHYVCHYCDEQYIGSHQCYIKGLDKLKKPSTKYIFYDFECTLDDGVHQVAGAVAMTFNDPTPVEFQSLDAFLQWVFSGDFKGYTCIGHNAGRYDFHFIKQATLQRGHQFATSDISNGNTTYYSKYTEFDITFIDSYRFISRGLRAFPKIFGLTELKKGFFPYRFFTTEHLDYKGPMPEAHWFDFDGLKEDEREEGLMW
jgi:hypothetical protein